MQHRPPRSALPGRTCSLFDQRIIASLQKHSASLCMTQGCSMGALMRSKAYNAQVALCTYTLQPASKGQTECCLLLLQHTTETFLCICRVH